MNSTNFVRKLREQPVSDFGDWGSRMGMTRGFEQSMLT